MENLVSIIMNCRNGEQFLRESLNSIIAQTYKNWELIFVDNMSTDNSKKIFEEYKDERFKYYKTNSDMNLGAARQIALNNCKGEFISFLDTDDLWKENKLEKQIPYFEDLNVGMVISNSIFFSKKKEKIFLKKKPPTGYILDKLLKKNFISLETLICRTSFINKISFQFDLDYSMISDLDLTLRLSKISKLKYVPLVLAKWRIHENSETWKKMTKFFSEKILLFSKLQADLNFNDTADIQENLLKFRDNSYYSIIFYQIEYSDNKDELLLNLKKISFTNLKYFLVLLLINVPFKKKILKFYRKLTQLSP